MRGTKVYAVGVRAEEMPLQKPESKLVDSGAADLKVPPVRRPRRKVARMVRNVPGYAPIYVDTNDPYTQECGLRKRLLRDIPAADKAVLEDLRSFVRSYCVEHYSAVSPLSFEEWLETTSYSGGRKEELRRAFALNRGGRPSKKVCSRIQSFGKTEFYESYKFLRWINSRKDCVKAFLGPYMKAIEEEVYKDPHFIKHIPVRDRPNVIAMLRKAGRRYFITDFTAFESHFTPEVMDVIECELYRHCLSHSNDAEYICDILKGVNYLKTRAGVSAQVAGRRMSGDMCTSLGNGFTNLMLALYVAFKHGFTLDGFVEGDDGIFAVDGQLKSEFYNELGWTIKLQEVVDPCTGEPTGELDSELSAKIAAGYGCSVGAFCGVLCSKSGQIIRDPRKFFQGFGWIDTCIHASDKVCRQLWRAKALSAAFEAPACPIVTEMARRGLRETRGLAPRFDSLDTYHVNDCPRDERKLPSVEIQADTRELFARLYGVSVPAQLAAEARIREGNFNLADLVLPGFDVQHYESRYVEAT